MIIVLNICFEHEPSAFLCLNDFYHKMMTQYGSIIKGYRWCLFTNVAVQAMNADGLSWQKTAKHSVFPNSCFIWLLKRSMRALVFVYCSPSRACSGNLGLSSNPRVCRVKIGVYSFAYMHLQQCWVQFTAWRLYSIIKAPM